MGAKKKYFWREKFFYLLNYNNLDFELIFYTRKSKSNNLQHHVLFELSLSLFQHSYDLPNNDPNDFLLAMAHTRTSYKNPSLAQNNTIRLFPNYQTENFSFYIWKVWYLRSCSTTHHLENVSDRVIGVTVFTAVVVLGAHNDD